MRPAEGPDRFVLGETRSPDGRYVARYGKTFVGAYSAWWVELASADGLGKPEQVLWNEDLTPRGPPVWERRLRAQRIGAPPPPRWEDGRLRIDYDLYGMLPDLPFVLKKIRYRDTVNTPGAQRSMDGR